MKSLINNMTNKTMKLNSLLLKQNIIKKNIVNLKSFKGYNSFSSSTISDKVVVTAALNGVLTDPAKFDIPVTPEKMAIAASEAYDAGASVVCGGAKLNTGNSVGYSMEKPLKKTFLFTLGYNGKPYHGNTYQPNRETLHLQTVEKEILDALEKTKVLDLPVKIPVPLDIPKKHLSKYQVPTIKRTSRTDKGVSSKLGCILLRAQIPSDEYIEYDTETKSYYVSAEIINKINDNLSKDVKIFNMMKTKKKLDIKKYCTGRVYEYYLPLRVFEQFFKQGQTNRDAVVSSIINKLNAVLSKYVGNKRINSFTKNKGAHHARLYARAMLLNQVIHDDDNSMRKKTNMKNSDVFAYDNEIKENIYVFPKGEIMYRAIYKCYCDNNIVSVGPDDNKYLRIELFGESFVYNQIRYMIGLAVAVVNEYVPLQYLNIAVNGRVGLLLPKAPANGLVLKSYVFNPKINLLVNEKQRMDVFGITEDQEKKKNRDENGIIVLHNNKHDKMVDEFFQNVILPAMDEDIQETVEEWKLALNHGLPSKQYCNLLYADHDQFKKQREIFLMKKLEQRKEYEKIHEDNYSDEFSLNKSVAFEDYRLLYISLITRYNKLPGKYIDDVYKAVLYHLKVTRSIYNQIPSMYLPSNRTGCYNSYENTEEVYVNQLKLNEVICDIIDKKGLDYYAKQQISLSAIPKRSRYPNRKNNTSNWNKNSNFQHASRKRHFSSASHSNKNAQCLVTISYPNLKKPIIVFTAGAPGSGKTYSLDRIYGLGNILTLDLDEEMKNHPDFDENNPAKLYNNKIAYQWANERLEKRYQNILMSTKKNIPNDHAILCIDGTGTHIERQVRRMTQAKDAGFWIVQLYVQVSFETAVLRNEKRKRSVPINVLKEYCEELEYSIDAVLDVNGLIDEYVIFHNDRDDNLTSKSRWGKYENYVWKKSEMREKWIDFSEQYQHKKIN